MSSFQSKFLLYTWTNESEEQKPFSFVLERGFNFQTEYND